MSSFHRLAFLSLALVAGLGFIGLPDWSAAQTSHFAFADTTLLRDTLDLHFTGLFEVSDSLAREYGRELSPDSLRAHVIRYRLPIRRLLALSDSMHVPVDSVGIYIDRERFNPLSASFEAAGQTSFKYRSNYTIGQTTTSWLNGADFLLQRGTMILRNGTDVTIDRTNATNGLSLRQTRNSRSEATWRLSKNVSMGGVATLSGYDASDPGNVGNESETKSEFQFSSRSRQQMRRGVNSDINLLTGYLDLKNSSTLKRGVSGDLNGHSRIERGDWFSHDFTAGVNGNVSSTGKPTFVGSVGTHDLSGNIRGGLQLYQATPVGLNLNYSARHTVVESPIEVNADTLTGIPAHLEAQRILTTDASTDATVRLRVDNNRYLNLTGNLGTSSSLQGQLNQKGWKAQARWVSGLWQLDADGGDNIRLNDRPRQNGAGGYNDRQEDRSASATLERPFSRRLTGRLKGEIGLSQYRSTATADSAQPPTPRDNYTQLYRIEAQYVPGESFTTNVALEVSLRRNINLPSTSTSNNTDTRSYRAEWRWSYRLLRGLTASQVNTIQSDYDFFPFAPERNDLSIDYSAVTDLNAIVTPRLSIDLQHNARQQPHGDWRVLPDGTGVLLPSDENLNYTLRATVSWAVAHGLSLSLVPEYLASDRTGTSNGVAAPTRTSRHLGMSGRANLDFPLGHRGHLLGDISRTFTDDRSTTYLNGLPQPSPLAQRDFWTGSLGLTWDL